MDEEAELQELIGRPQCNVVGCENLGIDERGPVSMRKDGETLDYWVCWEHWMKIFSVLGHQRNRYEESVEPEPNGRVLHRPLGETPPPVFDITPDSVRVSGGGETWYEVAVERDARMLRSSWNGVRP